MLLHDQRLIEEVRAEIKEFLEFNENESMPTRSSETQQRQC
jgi:hypothetical protein